MVLLEGVLVDEGDGQAELGEVVTAAGRKWR